MVSLRLSSATSPTPEHFNRTLLHNQHLTQTLPTSERTNFAHSLIHSELEKRTACRKTHNWKRKDKPRLPLTKCSCLLGNKTRPLGRGINIFKRRSIIKLKRTFKVLSLNIYYGCEGLAVKHGWLFDFRRVSSSLSDRSGWFSFSGTRGRGDVLRNMRTNVFIKLSCMWRGGAMPFHQWGLISPEQDSSSTLTHTQ